MSTQIAVRLDEEDLMFIDELVTAKQAESRADVVRRGLELVRRQEQVRRDIDILTSVGRPLYPDLELMHEYLRGHPLPLDD